MTASSKMLWPVLAVAALLAAAALYRFGTFPYFHRGTSGGVAVGAGSEMKEAPRATGESGASFERKMTGGPERPSAVELSDQEQRAIGLETEVIGSRNLARPVVAVGKVEAAETGLSTISARIGGRIDKLLVDSTGQTIHQGQALALLYSPDVVATAQEYKLALENRQRLPEGALPQAVAYADELVTASRRRLELWGLTPQQIQEIAASAQPKVHITIHSSANGIVTERKVAEGQYVKEGDPLYTIHDLSTVWVKAEVYESDLPLVRVGEAVEITSEALPGATLRAQVSFIEPMVNQQTRTAQARIPVGNPELRLRPGMFTNVKFLSSQQSSLAVPRTAVLDTGAHKVVYVAKQGGIFEGRQVELGPPGEEYYPVLSGLKEGERVVTHGNFLIDSQTRITGGMTGLFGGSKEFAREPKASPVALGAGYQVTFKTEPDPPKGASQNIFRVSVVDTSGKPISDARVKVTLVMPAMPSMGMPEMRESAELSWKGSRYEGTGNISMAGTWNTTVEVSRGGRLLATHRTRLNARP